MLWTKTESKRTGLIPEPMRLAVLLLTLLLASCGAPTARFQTQEVAVDATSAAELISRYRASRGLPPVSADSRLNRMAAAQARANAEIGDLSHEVGGSFPARLASFGAAERGRAAENLAAGGSSLEGTIEQWKRSPEHNKNLLMPQAAQIGIARVDAPGTRYKHFWALVLADR
jgi:uncharacterized protein YkwD